MKRTAKFFAVVLTLVMVCAMTSISASAATTYTPIGGSTTFVKNLVVNDDANIPNITFTYTITRADPVAATASTIEILQSPVGATIGTAAFTSTEPGTITDGKPDDANPLSPTSGFRYASKEVSVTFPSGSFTKPGVYRYIIVEGNGGVSGVTYDTSPRYLDVFVTADPSTDVLHVDSYSLRSTESAIGLDHNYETEPSAGKQAGYTNSITQFDFDFSKIITGNQGDKNKRFTFTLNITGAIPGTYPVTAVAVDGNPTTITVAGDGHFTGTFDLTNGSSLKVLGLNQNAKCTISEDAQDYTAALEINEGGSVSNDTSGELSMTADTRVVFTNTRDGVIPTGVLLTVAPFAVGLFLFGAAGVYFVAKRKYADED